MASVRLCRQDTSMDEGEILSRRHIAPLSATCSSMPPPGSCSSSGAIRVGSGANPASPWCCTPGTAHPCPLQGHRRKTEHGTGRLAHPDPESHRSRQASRGITVRRAVAGPHESTGLSDLDSQSGCDHCRPGRHQEFVLGDFAEKQNALQQSVTWRPQGGLEPLFSA